jgi:hypothetical protein
MYSPSSGSAQLGASVGDCGGSITRFLAIVVGLVGLWIGIVGSIGDTEVDTLYRLFFVGLGSACFVQFYLQRGTHAELFEHGFTISRGGKTTTGRWEDIANVTHGATRQYLFGLIPLPFTVSHTYTIALRNGERVKIDSAFSKAQEAGDTIQRMWRKAVAAKPSRSEP